MKNLFIYLITMMSISFAQDWGGQSGGFLRMGMTARSLSMGGGFTAELDQSFPVVHNPAWSAFLKRRYFGSSYTNLTLDRRLAATSFSMSLPPTAGLGVAWVYGGVSDIQGRYSTGMKSSKMQTPTTFASPAGGSTPCTLTGKCCRRLCIFDVFLISV